MKIQVLDFFADWCGPCRAMSPQIESLMETYNTEGSEIEIKKVNVDTEPDLTSKFGIRSIPTLVFVKDGAETDRMNGVVPKEKIIQKINESLVA